MDNNKINAKEISCKKQCFYKEKSENYKNVIEDLQKDIIGNNNFMDSIQDNYSKYSDDPILYSYEVNNRYIKEYIKLLKCENRLYLIIIVVLIIILLISFM